MVNCIFPLVRITKPNLPISIRPANWRLAICGLILWSAVSAMAGSSLTLPSPQQVLGFVPGTSGRLADPDEIVAYFYRLAAASPRIKVQEFGKTAEGRPLILVICSAPENLDKLTAIRENRRRLMDPRQLSTTAVSQAIDSGKVIVSINCSIHAREVGPAQMSALLAWNLAADSSATVGNLLRETVVLLIPVHNPDGLARVAEWNRNYQGSRYAGGPLPFLDHPRAGHDINRDWFMLTQPETRLTVEHVYNVWHPHVVVDLHQMGSRGPRLFLPPYIDPHDQEIDPWLQSQMAALGTTVAARLTAEGKRGVAVHACFDAFSPSRAYVNYHGGLRFLIEIASARMSDPIELQSDDLQQFCGLDPRRRAWNLPLPWTGGRWQLEDIVDYGQAAVLAVLQTLARDRQNWLASAYRVARQACADDSAQMVFFLPPTQQDPAGARELLQVLQNGDVEFYQAQTGFSLGDTLTMPAGTVIVPTAQPHGAYARTLLANPPYPSVDQDGAALAYDVTTHCLPLYFGTKVYSASGMVAAPMVRTTAEEAFPPPPFPQRATNGFLSDCRWLSAYRALADLWEAGAEVFAITDSLAIGPEKLPPGTFWCNYADQNVLQTAAAKYGFSVVAAPEMSCVPALALQPPRIGLYGSHLPHDDAGWTQFLCESYGLTVEIVTDADLRQGSPQVDVLIFSDQPVDEITCGADSTRLPHAYTGGLSSAGVHNLANYLQGGGRLVLLNRACLLFNLQALRCELPDTEVIFMPLDAPGSLLRGVVAASDPLGWGMAGELALFNRNGFAFSVSRAERVIDYPSDHLLLSGIMQTKCLPLGACACATVKIGRGEAILCGFQPQFRCQTLGTLRLLLNACIYSRTTATVISNSAVD